MYLSPLIVIHQSFAYLCNMYSAVFREIVQRVKVAKIVQGNIFNEEFPCLERPSVCWILNPTQAASVISLEFLFSIALGFFGFY